MSDTLPQGPALPGARPRIRRVLAPLSTGPHAITVFERKAEEAFKLNAKRRRAQPKLEDIQRDENYLSCTRLKPERNIGPFIRIGVVRFEKMPHQNEKEKEDLFGVPYELLFAHTEQADVLAFEYDLELIFPHKNTSRPDFEQCTFSVDALREAEFCRLVSPDEPFACLSGGDVDGFVAVARAEWAKVYGDLAVDISASYFRNLGRMVTNRLNRATGFLDYMSLYCRGPRGDDQFLDLLRDHGVVARQGSLQPGFYNEDDDGNWQQYRCSFKPEEVRDPEPARGSWCVIL